MTGGPCYGYCCAPLALVSLVVDRRHRRLGQPPRARLGGAAVTGDAAQIAPRDRLVSAVERLQDELSALRHEVNEPTAPLSMGQRADAAVHLAGLAAGLGNLKRTIKREDPQC